MPRFVRIGFLLVGCGVFVYLLVQLDPARVLALLAEMGWAIAWIAAAYTGHQFARALAYRRCVAAYGSMPYWDLVKIRFAGEAIQFLTFSGPFLSLPAQAMFLKRSKLTTAQAFAATVSEYIVYTFASAVMAVAALAYLLETADLARPIAIAAKIVAWGAAIFLAASAVAIVMRFYLIGTILNGLARLPLIGKKLRVDPAKLRSTEDLLFVVLREQPGAFSAVLALEFFAQLFLVAELFVLLPAIGQFESAMHPLVIEGATKFLTMAFFFVPGQVGASEGIYVVVFQALGLSTAAGFSLALARRLRNFLTAAVGLIVLARTGQGLVITPKRPA